MSDTDTDGCYSQDAEGVDCPATPAYRFTWPGKPETAVCEKHGIAVRKVAAALGMYLQLTPMPEAMRHFNALTPAQAERLALLLEELGEASQAVGKILRHGYDSSHPGGGPTNREWLQREMGDILAALDLLTVADLDRASIDYARDSKRMSVGRYLHHAEASPLVPG